MISYELAVFIGGIVLILAVVLSLILKVKPKNIGWIAVMILYLTAVACVTLFPIDYDSPVEYGNGLTWYNFIPFKSIADYFEHFGKTSMIQLFGNIAMTVPFGILVLLALKKPNWWKLLLIALALPIVIESAQAIIGFSINSMYRMVDIDDVILNALGVYIGYGICKIGRNFFKKAETEKV